MIEITIKTLDSQNHSFSVGDDTTVKQFKEKIFETLPFPVDSQRLIHCGRVLQDDKKLSEYDVNGKVVHLVQRPPPQASAPAAGAGGRTNGTRAGPGPAGRENRMGARGQIFRSRLDGTNAMYLGAMAIPADVMDASGITMPQPSQSLSQSRLSIARRMIRSASATLALLETAESGAPAEPTGTPPTEPASPPATPPPEAAGPASAPVAATAAPQQAGGGPSAREVGIILVTNQNEASAGEGAAGRELGAGGFLQPSTAAVIASAFSAARSSGIASHMTISRQSPGAEAVSLSVDMDAQGNITHVNGDNYQQGRASSSSSSSAESASPPLEPSEGGGVEPPPPLQRRPSRQGYARPLALATLMEELGRVNERLRPFSERYQQLLQADPSFEGDEAGAAAANRVFSHVSEVMHCLAHANHAISDVMCDYAQPAPRVLRCRPVLIQHSAVLQAGIPVGAFGMLANRAAAAVAAAAPGTTPPAPPATGGEGGTPAPPPPPPPPPREPQDGAHHHHHHVHHQPRVRIMRSQSNSRGPTTVSSLAPNNIEFVMEVAPGTITIDSMEATLMSGSTGLPLGPFGSMDVGALGENGFPWGSPAPPEFLQNLMQAVAGHMIDHSNEAAAAAAAATTSASTAATTTGSSESAASAAGQTSQARGNTATHPTTSTQTRSTSRPHVHLAQSMGPFTQNSFDPFLPCHSHHVMRSSRRGWRTGQRPPVRAEESVPLGGFHVVMPPAAGDDGEGLLDFMESLGGFSGEDVPAEPPAVASPGAAAAASIRSPLYNLFNHLGGHGLPPSAGEAPAVAVPPLIQQIMQGLGGAILGRTAGSTLADILRSMPEHSFRDGESLLTDFVFTVAQNITLSDLLRVSVGRVEPLNNLLPPLRDFVQRRVLDNQPPNPEIIGLGAERLTSDLRPFLDVLLESRLREDVDVARTVMNFNEIRLAELIRMVAGSNSETMFGAWLTRWFRSYLRELFSIVRYCCTDGIENILQRYLRLLTHSMPLAIQDWAVASAVMDMGVYVSGLGTSHEQIRNYLIPSSAAQRRSEAAQNEMQQPPSAAAAVPHGQAAAAAQLHADEPMETDVPLAASEAILVAEESLPSLVAVPDAVPVILPESWHSSLPSDWVPIIARDAQRQRRQNPQPAFSDAYLSEMPSKRRKVVAAAKPHGSLNQVISENVRNAVVVAGVSPNTTNVEPVLERAGLDPLVQAAYREQVRSSVRDSITNNSDFEPEKYPNTAKYFTKK